VLGLVAVAAIAGLVLWIVLAGDDQPTATFDGQAATYRGPTTVSAGVVTFTFDATAYDDPDGVAFTVSELTDDTIDMAAIVAAAASTPASGPLPPFIGTYNVKVVVGEVVEASYRLTEGRWVVTANTAPADSDRVYPAAIIEVTAD
jgi:autotransporter-associated beta strand protein